MEFQGKTASSGVRDSYYGFPVIKAPQWRWLIISYLFFGGVAGAAHTIATISNLVSRDRTVERVAHYISFAALAPCPPLLILDLGRPDRFLNMLRVFKVRSPMSLGSWALSGAGVFSIVAAMLQLLEDFTSYDTRTLRRIVGILGLPFSIFLSGYTGILLVATNVPLWWRSAPLLSPAFISSAYSSTFAAIALVLGVGHGERETTGRRLARAEIACLATELTLLTAITIRLGRIGRPLTTGRLGMVFWPVTYLGGVLVPLVLLVDGAVRGSVGSPAKRRTIAMLGLFGGFSLRSVFVLAGKESAQRPEDYFAMTGGTRRT